MKIKGLLLFALAVASFSSCLKEDSVSYQDPDIKTFIASSADGVSATRAVVSPDGSVQWTPGETIRLFYKTPSGYRSYYSFTNVEQENSSTARFQGNPTDMADDSPVYAVSPEQDRALMDFENGRMAVVVPIEQTATEGSFDPEALVSIAKAEGDRLHFYNVIGGVRFKVSDPGIDKVEFFSNGGEYLSGYAYVTPDGNGFPAEFKPNTASIEDRCSKRFVILTAPEGTTFKTGVWYYMAVYPTDLSEGGTLVFYKNNVRARAEITKPLKVKRAGVGTLTNPDAGASYDTFMPDNEIYYKTTDGSPIDIDPTLMGGYPEGNPIVSHTYQGSWGVITFKYPVYEVYWLFSGKKTVKEVVFPDRVEYLDRTITDCPALQRVVLPRNLKKVSLTLFPTDHYLDVVLPEGMKAIPDYLFSNCTWLQTVTIPDSIESIGNSAFSHTALLSVKFPSGLREIGNYAFSRTDLSAVSIPSGVKTIGEYAFSGSGLTSVSGGGGLEAVGKFAFSSNPRLTRVSLDAAVPPTAAGAVFSYPYITVLNVPEQSVDAYKSAPYWEECYVCHGSPYQSKSFARDGEVVTLQTASSGNGIDITFLGDAYTDRYVSDGTYDRDMRAAAEAFFDAEPFKTYRNLFNVYYVVAVSKDEIYKPDGTGYAEGETALKVVFSLSDTWTTGDQSVCADYVQKAVGTSQRTWTSLAVVVLRGKMSKGTCYNNVLNWTNDWSSHTFSRAYCAGRNPVELAQTIRHEAGGHGFGKLGDEYDSRFGTYTGGSMADSYAIGHNKNISVTSNRTLVPWAKYLNDSRYAAEELGVYEGAMGYEKGAYRPSINSIMNDNTGFFNAPSREAIYYRMHKLAYGASWTYNHETFVAYDKKNIKKHEPSTK